jgi:hypothetical protein
VVVEVVVVATEETVEVTQVSGPQYVIVSTTVEAEETTTVEVISVETAAATEAKATVENFIVFMDGWCIVMSGRYLTKE